MREKLVVLGVALLAVGVALLTFLFIFDPKVATNYEVSPRETLTLTFDLHEGQRLEGYFTVIGGDEEIRFHIEDPYGNMVHQADIVKRKYGFTFTATYDGAYALHFMNPDRYTEKAILLTLKTSVEVLGVPSDIFFVILGLLIASTGITLTIVGGLVPKSASKESSKN